MSKQQVNKFRRTRKTEEWQRHVVLLELGIEHSTLWKPHRAIRTVVTRIALNGQELRVSFRTPEDRTRFLRNQRAVLKEVRDNPESRTNLDRDMKD